MMNASYLSAKAFFRTTLSLLLAVIFLGTAGVRAQSFTALNSTDLTNAGVAYGIALGDYDNDGDLDVFWGVPGADKKLLRNDGAGNLTQQFSFPTASGTEGTDHAAFADFNGDGFLDVVFVNGDLRSIYTSSQNRLFINNRNGTFTEQWSDGDTGVSTSVATGDFNGDGKIDYAVANRGGSSKIWLNNGLAVGSGFGFTDAAPGSIAAEGVTAGDVDADGDTDLVFSNGTIVFQNAGSFATGTVTVGGSAQNVAIAQMDGAKGVDLVFAGDRTGQIRVFLENGAGGYVGQPVVGNTTDIRFKAELADINNDGFPDLVVVGYGAGFDSAFLNNGSGQLVPAGGLGWGGKGLAVGDMDGDGDHDVITADPNSVFRNEAVTVDPLEVVSTADSGSKTLRAAMLHAQGNPGSIITFNIPGIGPHRITLKSALPLITAPTDINGCSQPGTVCAGSVADNVLQVELNGEALPLPNPYIETNNGLWLFGGSSGSSIQGLVINGFGNKGIRIDTGGHDIINNFIGTDPSGTLDLGVASSCVELRGAGATNVDIGFNLLSGCDYAGVIFYLGATANSVHDNYIGTKADASGSLPNGFWAVLADQSGPSNTIADNIIGGPVSTADGFVVSGNYIGRNATGDALAVRGGVGVTVYGDNSRIGGTSTGEGNTFGALPTAVRVQTGSGNQIRQNAMDANGGVGIDLVAGTNADVQAPTLNSVFIDQAGQLQVDMSGLPAGAEVEVFRTRANRQIGEVFLGDVINVIGGGSVIGSPGSAAALSITVGDYVTVTSTDASGNTSRFSSEAQVSSASSLVVTSPANSGAGTLRAAIDAANSTTGLDTITFDLPSPYTISLTAPLPPITEPVIIDGYSQSGSSPNTAGPFDPDNAVRLIRLDGSAAPVGAFGLEFDSGADGSRVSGLDISGFKAAGVILRSNQTQISGNRIHANGSAPGASVWNDGIIIHPSTGNTVGGPQPADRNILFGNKGAGVGGIITIDLLVQGNFIGLEEDGETVGANLVGFAGNDHVNLRVLDNVISGNLDFGMEVAQTSGTLNEVSGNRIGTNANGTSNLGNLKEGILIWKSATNSTIEDNLIAFNVGAGIRMLAGGGAGPNNITLRQNEVISNASGITVQEAIGLWDAEDNTIANNAGNGIESTQSCPVNLTCTISGNKVYGNGESGIFLDENASGYRISDNRIGLDALGVASANLNGAIIRSSNNLIGPGNTISGNGGAGLILEFPTAIQNNVQSNFIGTDPTGTVSIPNLYEGVRVFLGATINIIGGSPTTGNVISGNGTHGVSVDGDPFDTGAGLVSAGFTTVTYNKIGVAQNGSSPLPNSENGVQLFNGTEGNAINSNTISGNASNAVELVGATSGSITGNTIMDNGHAGIWLADGTNGVTVSGNTVAGNGDSGIVISHQNRFWSLNNPVPAFGNFVTGNVSGLDAGGNDRGNSREGLAITFGAHSNIVSGNTFSGNGLSGVVLWEPGNGNVLKGNWIGTTAGGTQQRGNDQNGIIIGAVDTGSLTVIGGSLASEANHIAYNGFNGVLIKDPGLEPPGNPTTVPASAPYPNATITGNSIYSNGRLGIDLSRALDSVAPDGDGLNANDTSDLDEGPNGKLNYPKLTKAKQSSTGVISLDMVLTKPAPSTGYTIEVFSADSDAEEGAALLYRTFVTTDATSSTSQTVRVEIDNPGTLVGDVLVATATDVAGFTSEFSPPITIDDFVPRGYAASTVVDLGTVPSDRPRGVAAFGAGDFMVASGTQLTRYDASGVVVPAGSATLAGATIVDDIVVDGASVYAVYDNNWVLRLGQVPVQVPGVRGGAVSPVDGYLYVVAFNQVLRSVNAGGSFSPVATLPPAVTEASAITFNKAGKAFVAASSGQIYSLGAAPGHTPTLVWTVDGNPSSLAFAEDGRLFLTTQKQVLSGFPGSTLAEFMALPGGGGYPNSLAIGPKSRLFVAHEASGEVYRFSLPETQQVGSALTFVVSPELNQMLGAGQVAAAINGALASWEAVDGVDVASRIVFDPGTPGKSRASIGDTENTIALSNDALFLGPATLGVASKLLRIQPGQTPEQATVVKADILLNSRFHPTTGTSAGLGVFTSSVSTKDHDVQGVLTHELGHVLGLVHSSRPDATMFYSLPFDARDLTLDDRAAIQRQTGSTATGYVTISGQVTSGNVATAGMPVGGALVMATNVSATGPYTGENVHAYTDRLGNYSLSFLPPGDYIVGLFALDGSVFSSKLPLTPGRISRYLDTIANERNFLEEYWNDGNESATDDRNEKVTITLAAGGTKVANFITNIDMTPPAVADISVGTNPDAASLQPTIGLTFSERVVESSVSATIRPSGCVVPCAQSQSLQLVLEKTARKVAVASVPTRLVPGTNYVISVAGIMDDAGNVQSTPYSKVFKTRPADVTPPTVTASLPASGSTGISTATLLTVTFSEPIEPSTITAAGAVVLRESGGGTAIPGSVTIAANNAISFKPKQRLTPETNYSLVLTGLKDYSDNGLSSPPITFQTEVNPPLAVVGQGPAALASGVALETNIYIDFSEPIAPMASYPVTMTGPGSLGGYAELINDGKRLVYIPSVSLQPLQSYQVVVGAGLTDLGGTESVAPFSWSFTAGNQAFSWTSLSPSTGSIGALVTLDGTGFNPDLQANTVTFTGGVAPAKVISGTLNSLTVEVPQGTVSGPVTFQGQTREFKVYKEPETFDTAITKTATDNGPSDVDVSPDGTITGVAGPLAVVPNAKSGTVSLIEVKTGVEKSVVVGKTPIRVSITSGGRFAYVTNFNSHSVSVIDLTCAWANPGDSGCVDTIPVGFNPLGIDVSSGGLVYVANYSSQSVSVIDAVQGSETYNQAVRTIETDKAVTEVFTNPDGTIRWLISEASTPETQASPDGTLRKLQEDANPTDVESNPDGTGVWIGTNFGLIAVEVDFTKEQADWAVKVLVSETHPSSSDIDPDGGVPKLANESNSTATTTDPDGAGTITVTDGTVSHVESSPDGALVNLVMGGGDLLIYAVPDDAYSGAYQAVAKTGTDAAASSVATSPDGALLYVTSYTTGTVSIYKFGPGLGSEVNDPLQVSGSDYGLILIDVIKVGLQPDGIAYSPENNLAVVANSGSNDLSVLNFSGISGFDLETEDVVDDDADDDGIPDARVYIVEQLTLLETAASGKDAKDYKKALKEAEDNLDPRLWNEAGLPDAKQGHKVFNQDKQVVKNLFEVVERGGYEAAVAFELLELTVALDRAIAEDAIASAQAEIDATVCPAGKPGKKCRDRIAKAQKDLDKAVKEFEKGLEDLTSQASKGNGGGKGKDKDDDDDDDDDNDDDGKGKYAGPDYESAVEQFGKAWRYAIDSGDSVAGKGATDFEDDLPVEFALDQNYPNPFNPVTTIEFALPETAQVKLEVFDMLGRRVQTLVNGRLDGGYHSIQFDARDLASGVYLYRIQAGAFSKVHRMVLMK